MAKRPTITEISSGFSSSTQLNNNLVQIRDAFDNTLSRDGSTPNAMNADIDMNGYNITNVNNVFSGGEDLVAKINALVNRVTISSESPTGGQNDDIWFKITT